MAMINNEIVGLKNSREHQHFIACGSGLPSGILYGENGNTFSPLVQFVSPFHPLGPASHSLKQDCIVI